MKTKRRSSLDRGRRSPSIYSRTENQKEVHSSNWLIYFTLIFFVSLLGYLVFFSPLFKIKSTIINGEKFTAEADIKAKVDRVTKNILNNNLLTLSSNSLKDAIGEIAGIREVKIVKKYPNTLEINVIERTPALIWETINKKYLVDDKGMVTGDYEERFKDFPTVTDTKNVPVEAGKLVVPSQFSSFITELNSNFNTYTGAKIIRIEVPEITSEIKVTSDAGWYVCFDTTRTAKNELLNLSRVLSETKAKKKKLEYIDLRIDNRIFYK